jgi:hypothetical protein
MWFDRVVTSDVQARLGLKATAMAGLWPAQACPCSSLSFCKASGWLRPGQAQATAHGLKSKNMYKQSVQESYSLK